MPAPENEVGPLSYTRGADAPLLEMTLSEALRRTAAKFPDRDALIVCHQNIRLTWSGLDREVTRVARGLAGLGLRPGDRVGIWASNCVEWVLMQYASGRAGIVLVNVNPANRAHELRYVLERSRIRALVLRAPRAPAPPRARGGTSR
jgi:fatty-acyl-CoA synthase